MDMTGLEIPGFSEFTQISESHVYALINGTRSITEEVANKIAFLLRIKSWQIMNPDAALPESIRKAPSLKKFYAEYKSNPEYFKATKSDRKASYFIENDLLKGALFKEPVYVWQVKEVCQQNNKDYSSKQISQTLNYLVAMNKLKSEKRKLKRKNGEFANRDVLVYYIDKN